jgi:hypothetical protein
MATFTEKPLYEAKKKLKVIRETEQRGGPKLTGVGKLVS